jgi:hypothetical protein
MTSTTPSRRQWAWVLVVLLAIALVVIGLYAALLSARNSETNVAKNSANAQTLRLLKDCLTPGGSCYARQQKQTAGVLNVIGRSDVMSAAAAAWCAAEKPNQTFDAILRCTVAHVKPAPKGKP